MKKHLSRVVSLMLVLAMLASASLPAFAQGGDPAPDGQPTPVSVESTGPESEGEALTLPGEDPDAEDPNGPAEAEPETPAGAAEETVPEETPEETPGEPAETDPEKTPEEPAETDPEKTPEDPAETNPEKIPEETPGKPGAATPEPPAGPDAGEASQEDTDGEEPEAEEPEAEEPEAEDPAEDPDPDDPDAEAAEAEDLVSVESDLSDQLLQAGGLNLHKDAQEAAVYANYNRPAVINALRAGMEQWQESIDLSGFRIPIGDMDPLLGETINSSPWLFYATGNFTTWYNTVTGFVTRVVPEYDRRNYSPQSVGKFNAAVEEALQCVNSQMTPLEKALALHDYLAAHIAYDETLTRHNAYQGLVERDCVCSGYALAYELLMQKCGIPCEYVTSDPMNHAWNTIQLDGRWYHVDVTWDDPVPNTVGYVGHDYFLLSDTGFPRDSQTGLSDHYNWVSPVFCSDKRYEPYSDSNFWRYSYTAVIYEGRSAYYTALSVRTDEGTYSCLLQREPNGRESILAMFDIWSSGLTRSGNMLLFNSKNKVYGWLIGSPADADAFPVYTPSAWESILYGCHVWDGKLELEVGPSDFSTSWLRTVSLSALAGSPNTWRGNQYLGADGYPVTDVRLLKANTGKEEFFLFDKNGVLQVGEKTGGDVLYNDNLYYINPNKKANDPSSCYIMRDYERTYPGVGMSYYGADGLTYTGWLISGNKRYYQTPAIGMDGKPLKNAFGLDIQVYVWGAQQLPKWTNPVNKSQVIPAGNYLFGTDGVLVTGRQGFHTIPGNTAISGTYYLTGTDGRCKINDFVYGNHLYLFGPDGRKLDGGKTGRDVAMSIGGQPQTLYIAPNTDYAACSFYRTRPDLGITYYNEQGITYRGWVDGGNGKRLYQTVMPINGQEIYFIVWRAQYLPAGKDPVTAAAIPAGWYLFDDNGVLVTKAGTYTYPDGNNVDRRYEVNSKGQILKVDGKAPAKPAGA